MNAIDNRTAARVSSVLTALTALAALAGCSASTTLPRVATAPAGARVSAGPALCHATGGAKVVARRVFVPGGVEASEQGGNLLRSLWRPRLLDASRSTGPPDSYPQPASCPAPGDGSAIRANGSDESMLAWESHDAELPRITLGVATYDAPRAFFGFGIEGKRRVVEHTFYAPGAARGDSETAPQLTPIGRDRFLLAWVEGNVEGRQLRAQSVVGWGDPLGAAMVLSPPEASVIGRPSVVVAPTGYGLVTYVASMNGEFDVLATPVACAM